MALGRIVKPKVYLEGVEIPAYRVTVQSAIGGPAMATIEVPPAEEFFDRFEEDPPQSGQLVQKLGVQPRTLVHIFYEDSEDPDGIPRLLFEGEFVKFEYAKTTENRMLRIIARDISNILSNVYVRYYSDFFTPYANLMSIFTGQATAEKPNTESIRLALLGIGTGLNPELMEALQNDTGGFGVAKAFKDIAAKALGINTFFSNFDDRTKITKKIVSLADVKSRLLLDATQLASMIQQNMANLKESSTVWDLYTMLMSLVFYYPVPIAAAPFIKDAVTSTGSVEKGSQTFTAAQAKSLMSLLIKPYTWWTAPPTFNVIFPSQYKSFTMRRDFLSEPTRLIMSAFGTLESIAEEQLKKFSPSQFMFVAPTPLASRFDREAYDSQFEKVLESPSVTASEKRIKDLTEQKRQAEISSQQKGLTSGQKTSFKNQATELDKQIAAEKENLKSIIKSVEAQHNIEEAKSAKKPHRNVSARLWNRNVLTDTDGVSLASREDLKGIVFAFDYLTQTQVEVSKAKGISPIALKDYLSRVANYKLSLQQHQTRISEMTLHFSPQLVPGFPTLVIDPVRNYFGELDVVTHIFDANGLADTQVQVSFVRNDEVEFTEFARNTPGKIQFPVWINPAYLPESVGKEVYEKLFPKNKPDASKPGLPAGQSILSFAPETSKNQVGAANRIRKLYFAAKDRERFALGFTRRNIASRDQVFLTVLGAVKTGGNYVFNSLSDVRFQAALKYAGAANRIRSFAPADTAQGVKA